MLYAQGSIWGYGGPQWSGGTVCGLMRAVLGAKRYFIRVVDEEKE